MTMILYIFIQFQRSGNDDDDDDEKEEVDEEEHCIDNTYGDFNDDDYCDIDFKY